MGGGVEGEVAPFSSMSGAPLLQEAEKPILFLYNHLTDVAISTHKSLILGISFQGPEMTPQGKGEHFLLVVYGIQAIVLYL